MGDRRSSSSKTSCPRRGGDGAAADGRRGSGIAEAVTLALGAPPTDWVEKPPDPPDDGTNECIRLRAMLGSEYGYG
jgi:hypothetical protein